MKVGCMGVFITRTCLHDENLVKFCPFVLKILSGHKILTIFKGHNSLTNLQKLIHYNPKLDLERKQIVCYNPHLDLVNIKVHTKFGQTMSICFQDIVRKRNSDIIQAGHFKMSQEKIAVPYSDFDKFPRKIGVPADKQESWDY